MTKRSPFRYFKTSPEIIRLAVMMYVRFPLSLRNDEDLMSERCYRRQPISGHQDLRILFFNELGPREGSTAVAFPPPLIPENPFSVLGCGRIFLLFSKVIAVGLLSAALVVEPEMVL